MKSTTSASRSGDRPPPPHSRDRRRSSAARMSRWSAALFSMLALAVLNVTVSPPASAYYNETYNVRNTYNTSGQDIAMNTTFKRSSDDLKYGICSGELEYHWELSGAKTATQENKMEDQISAAINKIDESKTGNNVVVAANTNEDAGAGFSLNGVDTIRCADWIREGLHNKGPGEMSPNVRWFVTYAGVAAIFLAVGTVGVVMGGALAEGTAGAALVNSVEYARAAGCLAGALGQVWAGYMYGLSWKDRGIRALGACFSDGLAGALLKKVVKAIAARGVAAAVASAGAQGGQVISLEGYGAMDAVMSAATR